MIKNNYEDQASIYPSVKANSLGPLCRGVVKESFKSVGKGVSFKWDVKEGTNCIVLFTYTLCRKCITFAFEKRVVGGGGLLHLCGMTFVIDPPQAK